MSVDRRQEPPAGGVLRCTRYVKRWGNQSGPCNREAIAVLDGVPVCYAHAPVRIRDVLRDHAQR